MLKPHHLAWLCSHPDRTAEWLSSALREGFDVHHIDGDHSNNKRTNLVLIECTDHMMLHNGSKLSRLVLCGRKWGEKRVVALNEKCQKAYELRQSCIGWNEVSELLGVSPVVVMNYAKQWAENKSLPWPIDVPRAKQKKKKAWGLPYQPAVKNGALL